MRSARLGRPAGLLSGLFALLFGSAALLQFNDPDPALWVAAYASAAGLAAAAALHKAHFWIAAPLAALFALWTASLLPSLLASESAAFTSFRMHSPSHEEGREAIGLLLCAAYASWLAFTCRGRTRLNSP